MGDKKCAWCEIPIENENGSWEAREFRATGKDCNYFCSGLHLITFIKTRPNYSGVMTKTISEEP